MEFLAKFWQEFLENLTYILPLSPFHEYIEYFEGLPFLDWLNWFIPVQALLVVFGSWLGAVFLFNIYSIVMRWLKVIGD